MEEDLGDYSITLYVSANEKDYIGYELRGCETGREYTISISSYREPEPFEEGSGKVVCGCSSDSSEPIKCAPISPPRSPKPYINCISALGVELRWERAKEFGSAYLSVRIYC